MEGLGLVPGCVTAFDPAAGLPVPHIGWNDLLQKCAATMGRKGTALCLYAVLHGLGRTV